MKRLGSFVGLFAVLAVGVGPAAAVGSASIHLRAPSSIPAHRRFRVTAYGHAPARGEQFVFVVLTSHATCAKSLYAAEVGGGVNLRFRGKHGIQVRHGSYRVQTDSVRGGRRGKRTLCGYLYSGNETTGSKPEAKASHAITFTR